MPTPMLLRPRITKAQATHNRHRTLPRPPPLFAATKAPKTGIIVFDVHTKTRTHIPGQTLTWPRHHHRMHQTRLCDTTIEFKTQNSTTLYSPHSLLPRVFHSTRNPQRAHTNRRQTYNSLPTRLENPNPNPKPALLRTIATEQKHTTTILFPFLSSVQSSLDSLHQTLT